MKKGKPSEKAIETQILTYLSYRPDCFAWKNNTTGIYDSSKGVYRNNRNKFAITGVADILGVHMGRILCIEVKKPGGKLSQAQENFLKRIKECGGIAGMATCVNDVKEILKQ